MRPWPQAVPTAEQVEDWAESAAQGDVGALYDLANVDGARAAAVALIVLNDAEQRWFARANAATILGLLTEPGMVDALADLRSDRILPDADLVRSAGGARVCGRRHCAARASPPRRRAVDGPARPSGPGGTGALRTRALDDGPTERPSKWRHDTTKSCQARRAGATEQDARRRADSVRIKGQALARKR